MVRSTGVNTTRTWLAMGLAVAAFAATALAITDERIKELETDIAAAEAKLQALGDAPDEAHKQLILDVITKARQLILAESRKRRLVGDAPVASFDGQMGMMEQAYLDASARLANFETGGAATNQASLPPLPEGLAKP
jgi:hypothetical protein